MLLRAGFEYQHFGDQHAGIAHQRTAGLEQHITVAMATFVQALQQRAHHHRRIGRRLVAVDDAQATTYVDMVNGDAHGFYGFDQIQQTIQRVEVGRQLRDLRADVAADAHHMQPRKRRRAAVGAQGLAVGDAELVALQPGTDVGVRASIDIGIHAQADWRAAAQGQRFFVQRINLALTFDIEAAHTGGQRLAHFSAGFADAREHHAAGFAASSQHARQFTARDDVKARASLRKGLQHGQVGVGLHGITDQVFAALQGLLVGLEGGQHRAARIHKQRRAKTRAQLGQAMAIQPQFTVFTGQERRARQFQQLHREGAEAAVGAVLPEGNVNGPFWPQATRPTAHAHASKVASRRPATLKFRRSDKYFIGVDMQRIL